MYGPRWRSPRTTTLAVVAVAVVLAAGSAAPGDAARNGHKKIGTAQLRKGAVTAAKLHKKAVTTPKLRKSAVTTPKLHDNAVTRAKLAPNARPQLPRGISQGEAGMSSIVAGQSKRVDAAMIPAGHWMVFAKGYVEGENSSGRCDLVADGIPRDRAEIAGFASGSPQTAYFTIPFMIGQAIDLTKETQIGIDCTGTTGAILVRDTKILATQIRGIEYVPSSPP